MRIAIFSDVHANMEALLATEYYYSKQKIDYVLCSGDTVGYGGSPDACVDIVKRMGALSVLGNHDAAVSGMMDYSFYYDAARRVLDLHVDMLSQENHEWLKDLPYNRVFKDWDIELCHGSPYRKEEFDYIFTTEQARMLLPQYDSLSRVTFIGHSHLCKVFVLKGSDVQEQPADTVDIEDDRKYIISVGSVGQPRDYDNRASFTIYDTTTARVEFHRIEYDIEASANRISAVRLERSFGDRLFLGI